MPLNNPINDAKLLQFDSYNFRGHIASLLAEIEFPSFLTGYDIRFLTKIILNYLLNLEASSKNIPITSSTYLEFQQLFLSNLDDSAHRIKDVQFENSSPTKLIFRTDDRVGTINFDSLIVFLSKMQSVAASPEPFQRVSTARNNNKIQNFIVFKNFANFITLFNEKYSTVLKGNLLQHRGYSAILVILLLLEGKLKNQPITMEDYENLFNKFISQSPRDDSRFDPLDLLLQAKLITVHQNILNLTEHFFADLQKGETDIELKLVRDTKWINLAIPIVKLVNATNDLKESALAWGLDNYISSTVDKQRTAIQPVSFSVSQILSRQESAVVVEKPRVAPLQAITTSSSAQMRIQNLLSNLPVQPARPPQPAINFSVSQILSRQESAVVVEKPRVAPLQAITTSAPAQMRIQNLLFNPPVQPRGAKLGTQEQPISLTDDESEEELSTFNIASPISQISADTAEPMDVQETLSVSEQQNPGIAVEHPENVVANAFANEQPSEDIIADIEEILHTFSLLDDYKNKIPEMSVVPPEELDKIFIVLFFIKAIFKLKSTNSELAFGVETACDALTLYDNKLRDEQFVANIKQHLIAQAIVEENESNYQRLTQPFVTDLLSQQAQILVLIQNQQIIIPLQPIIDKVLLNPAPANNNQAEPMQIEKNVFINSTGSLENFTLIKETLTFSVLLEVYYPNALRTQSTTPARDTILIVLFLLEKYLSETPLEKIAIKSQMITAMLSHFDEKKKKRDHTHVRDKIRFLIKAQIIKETKVNKGRTTRNRYQELTDQFITNLVNNNCVVPLNTVEPKTINIRVFIEKLINLNKNFQNLATAKGLGNYVISNEEQTLSQPLVANEEQALDFSDIPLNDGEQRLNEILFSGLELAPSGTDFFDWLDSGIDNNDDHVSTASFLQGNTQTLMEISKPTETNLASNEEKEKEQEFNLEDILNYENLP